MNFTILVVALVMIHVYLVVAMQKGESSNKKQKGDGPGCTIEKKPAVEETGKEKHIVCKNGTIKYGGLYYIKDKENKIMTIELINVPEKYRRKGVASYLLDYFIDNIAKPKGYKTIKLTVEDHEGNGRANTAALGFYKSAGFTFDNESDENDGNMTKTL